jgi:hypothetical protein
VLGFWGDKGYWLYRLRLKRVREIEIKGKSFKFSILRVIHYRKKGFLYIIYTSHDD